MAAEQDQESVALVGQIVQAYGGAEAIERIVAVNAQRVSRQRPPQALLVHQAGAKVALTLARGSGDAVTAGICRQLEQGVALPAAVRYGVACGAANALTLIAGTVRLVDVRRLFRQVQVRCR